MFSETSWPDAYLATVGVFDGLHVGHRRIIESMLAASRKSGLPAILFTFDPRPVTIFAPGSPPDELTPLPRKLRLIAEAGIHRATIIRFSRAFAQVEAEDFLTRVLGAGGGLRGLWVGHDFRFGHGRRGDWRMIQEEAGRHGFQAVRIGAVERGGLPVSSSRIRSALRSGEVEEAAGMLGRYPDIEGEVVIGRGDGRKVLVPTANLRLPAAQFVPATGVYAGEAEWEGRWMAAVMNLGRRPTVEPSGGLTPEVHVLDFDGDLVGRTLLFRMRRRLRDERKFPSIIALRDQIMRDISEARELARSWRGDESPLPEASDPDTLPT